MQNRRWNGSKHCSRRITAGSQLASEAWPLIESLDDPILTVGLSFALIYAKTENRREALMCCIGQKGSSNWPTATRLKATSLLGLRFPGESQLAR